MDSSSSSSPEIFGATSQRNFSYKNASYDEVLEDLSSRFILNLPDDELSSLERICFQVEQAHWFYEDFIREENPKFPSLPLKKFSAVLFHACPLLHQWSHDHEQAFNNFMQYKTRVPVCGAIMLNDTWDKCVLVKGWKSSSGWGFPKGKINEVEPSVSCAIREVLEETGYNLAGKINSDDVIELSIKEQKISLFIVPDVPEDYPFKTKTRKEISKIEWFKLTELPTWKRTKTPAGRFYLISPFIAPLKAFINERKPRNSSRRSPKTKKQTAIQSRKPPSFGSGQDVPHESSSQSSSAENGEPHTPSPHCIEAQPNLMPQIANPDMPNLGQSDISMDPHFAQLLSGLAISAGSGSRINDVSPPSDKTVSKDVKATFVLPTSSLDSLDVSSTTQSTSSGSFRSPLTAVDRTIPTNGPSAPPPSNKGVIGTAAGMESSQDPIQRPHARFSESFASFRLIGSVRTPNTSPYLSRPHASATQPADRLKHIALLEAVSAESARLMNAYKTAAANGLPIDVKDNFKHPMTSDLTAGPSVTLSARATSPLDSIGFNLTPQRTGDEVSGVSRPDITSSLRLIQNPTPAWAHHTFPIRSRTSLYRHHDSSPAPQPSSSTTVPQPQISAFMSGLRTAPSPALHPHVQSLHSAGHSHHLPTPSLDTIHLTSTLESCPTASHPRLFQSAPMSPPLARIPPSNTLLSILNSRSPSRLTKISPTPSSFV